MFFPCQRLLTANHPTVRLPNPFRAHAKHLAAAIIGGILVPCGQLAPRRKYAGCSDHALGIERRTIVIPTQSLRSTISLLSRRAACNRRAGAKGPSLRQANDIRVLWIEKLGVPPLWIGHVLVGTGINPDEAMLLDKKPCQHRERNGLVSTSAHFGSNSE